MKRYASFLLAVFVLGLLSLALKSEAEATDIFVWMQGIQGESTVMLEGKKGWIDAESMSHQISQSGSMHVGGGGGSGKVLVGDIMLVKNIDRTTPVLNLLCSNGKHIPEVTIQLTRKQGQQYETYMEYTLKKVLVSSVGAEATKGKLGTELVTLNFARIHWKYFYHGAALETGWNIETNKEESPSQKPSAKPSGQTKPQYKPRLDRRIDRSRSLQRRY